MDLRLTDKVAIVTGSSRGIGKAIAAGLAAEGCRVTLCGRDVDVLEQSAAELRRTGAKILAVTSNLSRPEDPARLIEETVRAFGRVDILVNICGEGGRDQPGQVPGARVGTHEHPGNSVAPGSIFFPGGSWDRRLPQRGRGAVAVEHLMTGEP